MKNNKPHGAEGGYIALLSVLVVSGLFVFFSASTMVQHTLFTESFLTQLRWHTAFNSVRGCAENAMATIRSTPGYSGDTLTFDTVLCTISESSTPSPLARQFDVTGTYQGVTVQLRVYLSDVRTTTEPITWYLVRNSEDTGA